MVKQVLHIRRAVADDAKLIAKLSAITFFDTFKDSSKEIHYIPLDIMFGNKPAESDESRIVHSEWNWTNATYIVEFKHPLKDLTLVEIDPTKRMADVEQKNNTLKLNW